MAKDKRALLKGKEKEMRGKGTACWALCAMLLVPALWFAPAAGAGGSRDAVPWAASSTGLPANANYYGVALGDLNGDGFLDAVGAAESNGLKAYTGDGKGNWTAVASQPAASGGFNDVRLADIDKDGKLDIVAGTTGIKLYKGNGLGGFSDITSSSGLPTSNNWRGIALGDVNKDGNLDIASTSGWGSTGGIRVWTGDGTGKFKDNSSGLPGNQDRDCAVVLADFNADGNLDLAAGGAPGVAVYSGNGGSGGVMSWTASGTGLPTSRFSGLNVTDFNNDGSPDLLLSAYNAGGGAGLRAMRNVNKGASWTSNSTGLNNSGDFIDISSGDFDGDGNADILTAGSYGSYYGIHVFFGDGNGSWSWNSTGLPRTDQWVGSDVGDFNNDGSPDMLVGSYSNRGLKAYKNLRDAPPPAPVPLLSLTGPLGKASWSGGSLRTIGWTVTNGTPPYNISLGYVIGPSPAFPIAGPLQQADNGSGSYDWTLPPINSTQVKVTVNVTDMRNQTASNASPYDFEIDSAPPTATAVFPANGAQGVSNGTVVRLHFSEAMNRSSAEAAVSISGAGAPALNSPAWTVNDVVFQTAGLLRGQQYSVTVASSARDDSDPGNLLAAEYSFSFNTSDAPIPAISLNAPYGGEVWMAGSSHDITWDAAGGTGELDITLEYSTTGPNGSWLPIAADEPNDGIYEWTVPAAYSSECFVRATVSDRFAPPKTASDRSRSAFTIREAPVRLSVNLTAPRGGELWNAGTVQNITWTTAGGNGNRTVTLQYSTEGPAGPWREVASNRSDTGLFAWLVPETPSVACFVKLTVRDSYDPPQVGSDAGEEPFTIKGRPQPLTIAVGSPNGGENWTVGTRHNIAWTAAGGVAPLRVTLELSVAGPGGPWALVSGGEDNDGTCSWTVPSATSTDCHVRATLNDSDDPPRSISDASDRAFTIAPPPSDTLPPTVQITDPADGATVSGTVRVQLVATDLVGVTGMELFVDGVSVANFNRSPAAVNWDTTKLADGMHTLTARASDGAGNVGWATAVAVTVKNKGPAAKDAGFVEKYGFPLAIVVLLAVVALAAALLMRRRQAKAAPAPEPQRIESPPRPPQ